MAFCTLLNGQWCCIDTSLIIADLETQTLRFQISGASNNDLSDTTQGICGVRLKFEHDFVGDLTAQLISPGGQSIQLMGPIGKSGATKFSRWNVTFVPCKQKAIPDPGFNQKWSNLQSWGILGSFFNGTYYPFAGCLEDFNAGSVNGTWTLILKDNDLFYAGKLEQFCLLFCDNTGINCNTCNANGGFFQDSELEFCNDDPQLKLNVKIYQPNFIPDNNVYDYKYFIVQNDVILEITNQPDLRNFSPGEYSICGISYLKADSSKLPDISSSIKFSVFRNNVVSGQANMCAEMSKNCLLIKILNVVSPANLTFTVCSKDTFKIGTKSFTKSGIYREVLSAANGCDSIINLDLTVVDLNAVIKFPDELSCNNSNVILDLSPSTLASNTDIKWFTTNGRITDSSDLTRIVVNKKGFYKVIVSNSNCIDSAEVEVLNTSNVPELDVVVDTITCSHPIVTAKAYTNISTPSWLWKDSFNNNLGIEDSLKIQKAGKYQVIVSDQSGCTNIINFQIKENIDTPQCQIQTSDITCKVDSAFLSYTSTFSIINQIWSGPNAFSSQDKIAIVREKGIYTLTAQSANGCISNTSVQVNSKVIKPDFSYQVDTITCLDSTVQLTSFSSHVIKSIEYYIPGIFSTMDQDPYLNQSGRYLVRLIDSSECILDTFVDVLENKQKAKFQLQTTDIGCGQDSVQISLSHLVNPFLSYNYKWQGPVGYYSSFKDPYAKERGTYFVVVTSPNGCESFDSIEVKEDTARPRIDLFADTLNCKQKIAQIKSSVNRNVIYKWLGPNMFTSINSNLIVSEPGLYKVTVTSSNGCSAERSIEVIKDTIAPFSFIEADTITCLKKDIVLKPNYNLRTDSIYWEFNNQFFSSKDNPNTTISGTYYLFARGINGCSLLDSVNIALDTTTVQNSIIKDTITCKKRFINIEARLKSPDLIYTYITPALDTIRSSSLPNQSISGLYQLITTSVNGCSSLSSTQIDEFTKPTAVNIKADTITCTLDSSYIRTLTLDPNLIYQWEYPNSKLYIGSDFYSKIPGWYKVTVTNEFGCNYLDSILVHAIQIVPNISISDSVINCITKNIPFLEFTTQDTLSYFFWKDPLNNIINTQRIDRPLTGEYTLEASNTYGCKFVKTLNVQYDTLNPIFTQLVLDTFNCQNKMVGSKIELQDTNATYKWTGPNGFSSTDLNPIFPLHGRYKLSIFNKNFCRSDTTLDVILDTVKPSFSFLGDTINCKHLTATLKILSADPNLMIEWTSPTGSISNINPIMVDNGGLYKFRVTQPRNRCTNISEYELHVDTVKPTIVLNDYLLICKQDSVQLNASGSCPRGKFEWKTPTGILISAFAPFVSDTGTYYLDVICDNYCKSSSSLRVKHIDSLPYIQFDSSGILSCKNSSVVIKTRTGLQDTIFEWTGPGNFSSNLSNPTVNRAGKYLLHLQNNYGCSIDTFIIISIDTFKPSFQILQLDSFKCNKDTVRLELLNLSTNNALIKWTSFDGSILSDMGKILNIGTNGVYTVEVTDTLNGCSSSNKISIQDSLRSIIDAKIITHGITCSNQSDGSVEVTSILGGESPYEYSLNDGKFINQNKFSNLNSGYYKLVIRDKNLCKFDTTVEIKDKGSYFLNILMDSTIKLGESVQLAIQTNMSNVFKAKWDPTIGLSCIDCLNPIASPSSSTEYHLLLIDSMQCEVEDVVLIKVFSEQNIFVPNTFSPNDDGINDFFDFKVDVGIKNINTFNVYDRWGNLIYHLENFDPTSGNFGWNGTFKGAKLNPGVYAYFISATNLKGDSILKYGEITLVR